MKIEPSDYSVYFYYTGFGTYQVFIKNISADADFVRLMIGDTTMEHGKRVGHIARRMTISPLKPETEHVYLIGTTLQASAKHRMWIAFESVKRAKKNITVGTFMALSPPPSKWRKTIGSLTNFDIKAIDSLKTIDNLNLVAIST